jgi:NCAIR mutase (PurE)-related protein
VDVLATRVEPPTAETVLASHPAATYNSVARTISLRQSTSQSDSASQAHVAVVCAGTSDLPVAEEAAVTAEIMGNRVKRVHDVGVAGLHRMLARMDLLQSANVIVAVAGMEGALPSVLSGLVSKPVIAVPTSIGYGASFGGIAALLAMLNSCASGVTVVNIDNGFGAGYAASQINDLAN